VLVADEPTTALDVVAQTRIVSRLKRIQQASGMALLYITHDMGLVSHVADEVAVMYEGEVVEQAPTRSIFIEPRHPYTRALIDSIPRVSGPKIAPAAANHGYMNKGASAEAGCRYAFRCPRATAQCRDAAPPITQNNGTSFRCWNPLETG
jgi:oligopeptide/dipeptide ABC transporter ATP-binding protein